MAILGLGVHGWVGLRELVESASMKQVFGSCVSSLVKSRSKRSTDQGARVSPLETTLNSAAQHGSVQPSFVEIACFGDTGGGLCSSKLDGGNSVVIKKRFGPFLRAQIFREPCHKRRMTMY